MATLNAFKGICVLIASVCVHGWVPHSIPGHTFMIRQQDARRALYAARPTYFLRAFPTLIAMNTCTLHVIFATWSQTPEAVVK